MSVEQRLWAPWRTGYITRAVRRRQPCIFCRAARAKDDRAMHVIARGTRAFCLLNKYPYNAGHLMIAVTRHVGELSALTRQERSELMELAARMVKALTKAIRPHGFNLGVNLGRPAGAGIPGHVHLHVVPRWEGDTNFMPVTGGTKVMSRSLDDLYDALKPLARGRVR